MVEQAVIFGIEAMADIGIGYMVGTAARAMTPENASKAMKACIMVGGMALGGAASVKANEYIEDYAENLKKAVNNIKLSRQLKKAKKELEEAQAKVEEEEVKEEATEEKAEKPKKKTKKEAV